MKKKLSLLLSFLMMFGTVYFANEENLDTANVQQNLIIYQDDGTKGAWTTTVTDDAVHGTVYKFDTTSGQNSKQLCTEALPAGKYMMSVDFKVDASSANEARQGVIMALNTWPENIVVNPRFNAENKFYISYGYTNGFASENANKVDKYVGGSYVGYTVNKWHNMTFMIETTDSIEADAAQNAKVQLYIDGVAYGDAFEFKLVEKWKFQYLQMCAPKTSNGATPMYVDNIEIKALTDDDIFAIESVKPVLKDGSKDDVEQLIVKLNRPVKSNTVKNVTVDKTDTGLNIANVVDVVGQYVYITVSGLKISTEYTINLGSGIESIDGQLLTTPTYIVEGVKTRVIYQDDGNVEQNWTSVECEDSSHGMVYKFDAAVNQKSEQISTKALPAGKYIMSADFKVEASSANEARQGTIMAFNNWPENVVVYPRFSAENKFMIAYGWTNGFAGGTNKVDKYVGGTYVSYTVNEWHNMSFLIETTDSAEEGVAQNAKVQLYIDGVAYGNAFEFKLVEDWKFQYFQIGAPKGNGGVTPMYVDNIELLDVSGNSEFLIDEVTEDLKAGSSDEIEQLIVKFNQPVKAATLTKVDVKKDGGLVNIAQAPVVVGQYAYIPVTGLKLGEGYTINAGTTVTSLLDMGLSDTDLTVAGNNDLEVAYWTCNETGVASQDFAVVCLDESSLETATAVDGKYCWTIPNPTDNSENNSMNFIFSKEFKDSGFDGSEYDFEIVYYDGTEEEKNANKNANFFQVEYKSIGDIGLNPESIAYKQGTAEWKTLKFTLKDAVFSKTVDSAYDFTINLSGILPKENYYTDSSSVNPVNIHSVKVTRRKAKNPVYVSAASPNSGNSYAWFWEEKKVCNTYQNVSDEQQNVTVISRLTDNEGSVHFENVETVTLDPGESRVSELDFGNVEHCGIYRWEIDVERDGEIISEFCPIKLAILKTDPDGIRDKNVFLAVDSAHYNSKQKKMAADILSLTNAAGARVIVSWNELLVKNPESGEYELNWESHPNYEFVKWLTDYGMTAYGLLMSCPAEYKDPDSPGYGNFPIEENEIAAFAKYAAYVGENVVPDGFSYIELFNEPNLTAFVKNLDKATGAAYAKLAVAAKEALLDAAVEAGVTNLRVAGPGVTGITQDEDYTNTNENGDIGGLHYLKQAVEAGFAESFDDISVHTYTWNNYTGDHIVRGINNIKMLWTDKGYAAPNVWATESGYYKGSSYAPTDRMQGALNVRQILKHKSTGVFGDVYSIYAFDRKGYNPDFMESNFGLVNPFFDELKMDGCWGLPTEAALMVTAMNYVMADSTFVESYDLNKIRIGHYTSNKWQGKDILTLYSEDNSSQNIKIDLGVNEVIYFDELGNEQKKFSNDGTYVFCVDEAPVYILGDFDNVKSVKWTLLKETKQPELNICQNGIRYMSGAIDAADIDLDSFSVEIANNNTVESNFVLAVAMYNSSLMKDLVIAGENNADTVNGVITFKDGTFQDVDKFDKIKVMLLEGINNIKPIAKQFESK